MISFCLAFARPYYYTTSFCVCQYLFWNFFKKFFEACSRSTLGYSLATLIGWACTLYYISRLLSRTFFTFFPFFYLFGTSNSFYTSFCTTFWAFSMQVSQKVWRRSIKSALKICCSKQKTIPRSFDAAVHILFLSLCYTIFVAHLVGSRTPYLIYNEIIWPRGIR